MEVDGMQRLKLAGLALAAMFVLSALGAVNASAKPAKLDLTWNFEENQLKPGEEFKMANENAITLETSLGNVTCSAGFYPNEQGFIGDDETNNEKTDKIEIKSTYGTWSGASCSSGTVLGSSAYVEAFGSEYPLGTLNLSSSLKAELKTPSTAEPVYIYVGFSGGEVCYFSFSKLKGAVKGLPWGGFERMEVNFSKQKLKLQKADSGKLCPKKATITAPFAYQTTGPEAYYIFEHTD
jgi:hypothetical protein